MLLTELFNSQSIALNRTENISNTMAYMGEAFFPNRKKMGLDLSWIKTHKGLGVALKPSNFDAIPTIRPRGQIHKTKEEMPLFRESREINEHNLIEISRIKDSNDPYLQPVLDAMYDDVNDLLDGADIAVEKMRMQLLAPADGEMKITIGTADNMIYSYDYDQDNSWKTTHYMELTGSNTWDNPTTSKPLTDIRTAIQYLASIGIRATYILGNSNTFDYLLESEQMKNALISITGQTINFIDTDTVQEIIRRKLGLSKITYDKMYEDYDKVEKKFYPDNYITIVGDGQLGNMWNGTTIEELTTIGDFIPNGLNAPLPVDITVMENGTAIALQGVYKPGYALITTASRIALPSYEGMDSVFVIKVK